MTLPEGKTEVRRHLREVLAQMTDTDRRAQSHAACELLADSPEFHNASVLMLYLSLPTELDTAGLALRAWQEGKTVVVPRVSWNQRRMLPVEITSLQTGMVLTGPGLREPEAGQPIPLNMVDLVLVPGLGFTPQGQRIGRGMGFYDRFLAQEDFLGVSCGMAFEQQVVPELPVLEHDMPLGMLVTSRGIRRFASNCIART